MHAIRHRVGIHAPVERVYDALATRDGITQWWTRDVEGDATPGGELAFRFGGPEPAATMELVELAPPARVAWRCVQGADEWLGTTVTFALQGNGDETTLLFTHDGWREPVEFMHHCSTAWAYYLFSLRAGLEDGNATPWPDSAKTDGTDRAPRM
jgi:uncharacterized protein YndB with AHSA1/START domain